MSFSKPISGEDPIVVTVNDWIYKNWQLFVRRDDSSMAFKPPRRRRRTEQIDYTQTQWYRWINDPTVEDEGSKIGKLFRLRFRMPFLMFRDVLIPMVRDANIFSSAANVQIPLEIKVMFVSGPAWRVALSCESIQFSSCLLVTSLTATYF